MLVRAIFIYITIFIKIMALKSCITLKDLILQLNFENKIKKMFAYLILLKKIDLTLINACKLISLIPIRNI